MIPTVCAIISAATMDGRTGKRVNGLRAIFSRPRGRGGFVAEGFFFLRGGISAAGNSEGEFGVGKG